MIKLIGLDFDGVIIRGSNEGYFACYHASLESVGVVLDPALERERIVERWGAGHVQQLELLLKEHPELVSKAAETWETCLRDSAFQKRIQLIDGVREAIADLARSYTVVIVSGTRKNVIQELLAEYKIDGVSEIYSSYDVEPNNRKPHPFMLQAAMKRFGASPDETIFVGDMDNDVEMARAAKVIPVVALTGFLDRAGAEKLGVRYIVLSLGKLANILKNI